MFVTRWTFDVRQLRNKCPLSCVKIAQPHKCAGHGEDTAAVIIKEFEERAKHLIQNAKHKNLVKYVGIHVQMRNREFIVHLLQDFIAGRSINNLLEEQNFPNTASVTTEILQAIQFLHNMNAEVTHGYLNNNSIFLDKSAVCRIADFELIPYLMYLCGNHRMHESNDFDALGSLVHSQNEVMMKSVDSFIAKCRSGKVLTHSDLLQHSFLSNNWLKNPKMTCERSSYVSDGAKILEHFDIEDSLGVGRFGIVLQAKNHTDKKSYAMKFIRIPAAHKKEVEQIEREVEILSKLRHRNVVRYVTSWKQSADLKELKKYAGDAECLESTDSESSFQ